MTNVVLTGDKDLDRLLGALPAKMQKKFVRSALRKAGKIVLSKARDAVPVETGALKKGLKLRALKRQKYRIGVAVEHPTRERLAELQKDEAKGERIRTEKGYYPAAVEYGAPHAPARPHLRRGLEESKDSAVATFRQDVKDAVSEAKP
jgi:HK97 gp10 family phage protein